MNLTELKKKPIGELIKIAEFMGLEGMARNRKQDIIFAILKRHAMNGEEIFGDGVLEILSDGFGFLRSAAGSYLAGPDDIYVSPSQIRRFNWFLYNKNSEFDYHMNDDLGRMVLNPDVNVRSRGVMEKCSMCIQMTQATILKAKREGREVVDGEFQTACSSACSSGAMIFGDVNDKESKVAKLAADERSYHLLEHIGTKPNVVYHVKVRNS